MAQRGPTGASFGRVVEHDVEYDFQAGTVQGVDHRPEFFDLTARLARPYRRRVTRLRRKESDRVVAPIVGQTPLDEECLRHAVVDWQQFDRGHAKVDKVLQGRLVSQSRVGAAQLLRYARVACGESTNVNLVKDGVGERVLRPWH